MEIDVDAIDPLEAQTALAEMGSNPPGVTLRDRMSRKGYKEASRAIYDANITNLIAGLLLFYFGSGPIRGFAIVLVIGLASTVFTALFLTRMWATGWLKSRPADINI